MKKLLKKIRNANKLSQREMGIKLKLGKGKDRGQSFVSQIESGTKGIPLKIFYLLPRLFSLSKEELKNINDFLERKI